MTPELNSRAFYKLMLISAIIGAISAVQFFIFIIVLTYGTQAIWQNLAHVFGISNGIYVPLFVIPMCLIGGLAVGLITKYSKEKPMLLQQDLAEFAETGGIKPKGGYVGMIRGLVALLFGASIGPEGPLTGGSGGLGTWLAEKLKMPRPAQAVSTFAAISGMFGGYLGSPFGWPVATIELGLENGKLTWKMILPGVVAAAVGFAVYFGLTGSTFAGQYNTSEYSGFQYIHLVYGLFLGLLGGVIGIVFIQFYNALRRIVLRWDSHPIELALLAGLVLGLIGSAFPLVLFSGQSQINTLIGSAVALGIATLVLYSIMKVIATAVCLALGWAGGFFFCSFFMGASMGLAIHLIFPLIPEAVCMSCVMSGVTISLLKSPIAIVLIIQALFDIHLAPVIAIAVVSGFLLTYTQKLVIMPKMSQKKIHAPATQAENQPTQPTIG
ncbi:MAG: chloride channel protein [Nitrososphaerales archaeon]